MATIVVDHDDSNVEKVMTGDDNKMMAMNVMMRTNDDDIDTMIDPTCQVLCHLCVDGARPVGHHIVLRDIREEGTSVSCRADKG